jgi:mycofactocin precursor
MPVTSEVSVEEKPTEAPEAVAETEVEEVLVEEISIDGMCGVY